MYPAAGFAPELASRGVPVGEFNMEQTPATMRLGLVSFVIILLYFCLHCQGITAQLPFEIIAKTSKYFKMATLI